MSLKMDRISGSKGLDSKRPVVQSPSVQSPSVTASSRPESRRPESKRLDHASRVQLFRNTNKCTSCQQKKEFDNIRKTPFEFATHRLK